MLKWHFDQISGIGALINGFNNIEDENLVLLLNRLKYLENVYMYSEFAYIITHSYIEKTCEHFCEYLQTYSKSMDAASHGAKCLEAVFPSSETLCQIRSHFDNLRFEYERQVRMKLVRTQRVHKHRKAKQRTWRK